MMDVEADRELAWLVEELQVRRAAERGVKSATTLLFDRQLEAANDPAKLKVMLCGRRAGKSVTDAAWLIAGAQRVPRSLSLYITITARNAREIVWPALKWVCRQVEPDARLNEAELSVTLTNGAKVLCGGCKDRSEVEKYRGPAYLRVVVDECGSFPPYLEELLRDVLRPATIDHDGEIMLSGTPGIAWSGYWYELTGPERVSKVPIHHWTLWENPTLPRAGEIADEIRAEEGWDEDHPTWVREYLGRWIRDDEALVFPFDPERNQVAELPETGPDNDELPQDGWWFVLGVDVGQVDATAYTVMGAHPNDPNDYLIESSKASGLLADQVAADVRRYLKLYPKCVVVLDTGGMGRQHAEELRRRYGIPVIAAEKREKESAIRVMRDRLLAGRFKVLAGERNDAWRDEAAVCRWNEDRDDFEDDQEDHALHASLYAHRRLRHYRHELLEKLPPPGTSEAYRVEADEMKRAAIERVKKARDSGRRPKWDE